MLTKPQSFLREVANTCFKFFCVDCVNDANLMSLLTIVSTANAEADDIMDADGKLQPHPYLVSALHLGDVTDICAVGGVQALGMMAHGTKHCKPVDFLTGPGNAYVAESKL